MNTCEHYARTDKDGNISVRRVADDQEVHLLPGSGTPAWVLRFSPNGRFLAAKYSADDYSDHLRGSFECLATRRGETGLVDS